jgi:hypothetical protein
MRLSKTLAITIPVAAKMRRWMVPVVTTDMVDGLERWD